MYHKGNSCRCPQTFRPNIKSDLVSVVGRGRCVFHHYKKLTKAFTKVKVHKHRPV